MDILSEIIEAKRKRIATAKDRVPLDQLREQLVGVSGRPNFAQALRNPARVNLIAEFKRRSPSKGTINSQAQPAEMASIYAAAGAAALSILTEEDYFEGSLEDLRQVRQVTALPILRKDFIVDEYQVYESAAVRVSALLLIVAALDDETLTRLRSLAEDELGLTALVEVHTKDELDRAVKCGARVIGVNNRNLHDFNVSVATSLELAKLAPPDAILVSESGLTPHSVRELRAAGYRGFLVGENLMRAADPGAELRQYLAAGTTVKICGITSLADARAAIEAGADMLGFNFYPASPRYIIPDNAAEIIKQLRAEMARAVSMVGVFVNAPLETVAQITAEVSLDGIQLHGDETAAYCRRLKQIAPEKFVIKALHGNSIVEVEKYPADALMIDAFDPELRGGTGRIADWEFARDVAAKTPRLFLAGGLSPDTVAAAIAAVRPYAVDVCSSVETEPGRKSAARMKEFVDAVGSSKLPDAHVSAGEGN